MLKNFKYKDTAKKHAGNIAVSVMIYAILICIVFIILYPLFSYVSDMFMSFDDLMDSSVVYLPKELASTHVKLAVEGMDYWNAMGNSAVLCLLAAVLQMMVCTMVGYGFARYHFPFKRVAFAAVIFTMLAPVQLLMPSLYTRFNKFDLFGLFGLISGQPLRLLDSIWPFVIMSFLGLGTKNGLYIFIVRQFFRNMPKELEESGRIDGAGFLRIFFQIMVPNALTIIITVFLFAFSWQWTDPYWSNLFFNNFNVLPKALSILPNYGYYFLDPVTVTAMVHSGIILVILPILVLYLALQRFFIQGISRSGIVG